MVNTREILEKLRQKPIHRTFSIERAAVSKDSRTVKLAFASDKPVEHWFGFLELSMKGSSMRTDRLDSGAPLLVDHDTRDVVGVVEGYSIGMDGIARASVRFGESVRANEVFNDVQGGIRQNVSVGFIVHKMDLIKEEKGSVPAYRSSDWEPYEISIVAVPADISVGVGRSKSADSGRNKMPINDGENTELSVTEQTREIVEFAEIFNQGDLARNMIAASPSVTLEDVRVAIRAKQPPTIHVPPMDPRAIAERAGVIYQPAVSVPRHSVRNFTGENAAEKAYRFGQWVLGGVCGVSAARQWCVERGLLDRAMSEGNNAKGGNLVPEEFGNDLIVLIEQHGVFRRNVNVRPMTSDSRSDPLLTSELDSEFVGESEEGDDQDLTYSRVNLYAKKHMILVPFSSELSEDSSLNIGDQLAGATARAFAKKEDLCGFVGDATSTYGGMVGICTNLKSVSGTIASIKGLKVGSGNAYSELTLADFEGVAAILPTYADQSAKWYVSKGFYWGVMVKLLLASPGVSAAEVEGARNHKFLGYDVEITQVMPSTEANSQVCALLGDLSQGALLGDRRGIRISISDQALYRQDDFLFKATSRFDVNSSFGVGNTTVAGPIVGLITAAS